MDHEKRLMAFGAVATWAGASLIAAGAFSIVAIGSLSFAITILSGGLCSMAVGALFEIAAAIRSKP